MGSVNVHPLDDFVDAQTYRELEQQLNEATAEIKPDHEPEPGDQFCLDCQNLRALAADETRRANEAEGVVQTLQAAVGALTRQAAAAPAAAPAMAPAAAPATVPAAAPATAPSTPTNLLQRLSHLQPPVPSLSRTPSPVGSADDLPTQ